MQSHRACQSILRLTKQAAKQPGGPNDKHESATLLVPELGADAATTVLLAKAIRTTVNVASAPSPVANQHAATNANANANGHNAHVPATAAATVDCPSPGANDAHDAAAAV